MRVRARRLAVVWTAIVVVACLDGTPLDPPLSPPPLPSASPLVVSDPFAGAALAPGADGVSSASAEEQTFVSLPPGEVPMGVRATVRNQRTGAEVETEVVQGGFDPVLVLASAGDVLEVVIRGADGAVVETLTQVVLARRRPIVVRTQPPPQKRDVPLSAAMVVVFSEPIDPRTVTDQSVGLFHEGTPVAGTLTLTDPFHLNALLVPAEPLTPGTTYHLVVTGSVGDLDGDSLEAPVTVEFMTEPSYGGDSSGPAGQISFTGYGDGVPPQVHVMNADGSGVARLTEPSTSDYQWQPAWSPDGMRIAFVTEGAVGPEGIFVMNADGSSRRLVVETPVLGGLSGSPAWSPDGDRIAFDVRYVRYQYNPDAEFNVTEIWVVNTDGSGLQRVLTEEDPGRWGGQPAWSPGGRIAFVSVLDGQDRLRVMNPDGSGQATLVQWGGCCLSDPAWSPGGTKLAFSGGGVSSDTTFDSGDLYLVNADGSGLAPLTNGTTVDFGPTWSPDGNHLAFARQAPAHPPDIYVINASGSGVMRLTSGPGANEQPAWAPNMAASRALPNARR